MGVGWEENNEILGLDSNLPGMEFIYHQKKISSSLWLVLPAKRLLPKEPGFGHGFLDHYRDGKDFWGIRV